MTFISLFYPSKFCHLEFLFPHKHKYNLARITGDRNYGFLYSQVATAVLSITAKQKKKDAAAAKKAASGGTSGAASSDKPEKMDVEEEKKDAGSEKKDKEGAGEKKEATDAKKDEEKKEEKKPDPTFDILNNPARVMKPQLQVKRVRIQ